MAVIDYNFHKSSADSELVANRLSTDYRDILPAKLDSTGSWHGDAMSEIMAARGNDSSGMTGVMWRAGLRQYEMQSVTTASGTPRFVFKNGKPEVLGPTLRLQLIAAVRNGARVINLSSHMRSTSVPVTKADSQPLLAVAREIASALRYVESTLRKPPPLLVIIAGNSGIDAGAAGLPLLVRAYPRYASSVLIVAAAQFGTSNSLNLWSESNNGPLVDIAAPGQDINLNDPSGGPRVTQGTSVAAPYVAGVAGLLFSFDSSLTAPQVKQLILEGARNGGRTVIHPGGTYPFLDAYEALKAAARQPGARLCGNHVFSTSNGDVFAERANGVSQKLFNSTDGQPYTDLLNVLHGGKRIQIGDYLEFKWKSKRDVVWEKASTLSGNYHEDAGGAFLSWYDQTDHDGHTYAIVNGVASGAGLVPSLNPNDALGYTRVLPAKTFPETGNLTEVCSLVAKNQGEGGWSSAACLDDPRPNPYVVYSGWTQGVSSPEWAFAPQGNFVLIGVNFRWREQIIDPPSQSVPCTSFPFQDDAYCATYQTPRDSSTSIELWMVDTSGTQPWRQLNVSSSQTSRAGLNISWVAVDETGTEMVWELKKDIRIGAAHTCTNRVIEYRALPGHPTAQPGETVRASIPLPDGCTRLFGPATFAPFKGSSAGAAAKGRTASFRKSGWRK